MQKSTIGKTKAVSPNISKLTCFGTLWGVFRVDLFYLGRKIMVEKFPVSSYDRQSYTDFDVRVKVLLRQASL